MAAFSGNKALICSLVIYDQLLVLIFDISISAETSLASNSNTAYECVNRFNKCL